MPLPPVNVNDPNIPTVGQEVKVLGLIVVPTIQCQCDAKTVLQPMGLGAISTCPACKKSYRLHQLAFAVETGALHINIARVILTDKEPAKP